MERESLLQSGDEKRSSSPSPPPGLTFKDVNPNFDLELEAQQQRLRERHLRKRKCRRRFFHFLTISVLFGLVLWVKHGDLFKGRKVGSGIGLLYEGGEPGDHPHHPPKHDPDHDHDHDPVRIPRGVTLLQCTNWDGQDDAPPPPESPYPQPLTSLSSLFSNRHGNPGKFKAKGQGCHGMRWKKISNKLKFWKNKDEDEKNVDGLLPVLKRTSMISSYADFTFPLNNTEKGEENKFFFISRGWWSAGRVNVFQKGVGSLLDDESGVGVGVVKEGGQVKVHVGVSYPDEKYLEYVKVCKIAVNTGKEGEGEEEKVSTGVGIFTPEGRRHRRRPDHPEPFDVTIEFPEPSASKKEAKSKPITITQFIADFPLFSQTFGDLKGVYFEKFVAASVNEPLESSAIWGSKLVLSTVNAAITGTFKAFEALVLVTKNAPIEVDIELVQTPESVNSTFADLITTNGRILAKTNLTSTSEDGTGGNFTVGLATVKAPIDLSFPSAPINNTLYLGASTVLSPANITLHPTFEGTFSLKTLLASATLNAKKGPESDPEGRGRSRGLEVFQHGYGKLDGVTWWAEDRKWAGHVKVESTLSPVVLSL
ncbi:hypothetical protein MD484_g2231, partial [Candolleomyces efflorescens]